MFVVLVALINLSHYKKNLREKLNHRGAQLSNFIFVVYYSLSPIAELNNGGTWLMAVILSSNFYSITYNSHFHNHHHHHHHHHNNSRIFRITCRNSIRRRCECQASSKPSSYDFEAEDQRWLREEQRWLREEQRWLREERRWNSERQSLLRQISELSLQIQHLLEELQSLRKIRSNSADFDVDLEVTLTKMAAFLQDKNFNQISDSSDSKLKSESEMASLDSSSDIPSLSGADSEEEEKKSPLKKASSSLRVGAEGEEVRALQVYFSLFVT